MLCARFTDSTDLFPTPSLTARAHGLALEAWGLCCPAVAVGIITITITIATRRKSNKKKYIHAHTVKEA